VCIDRGNHLKRLLRIISLSLRKKKRSFTFRLEKDGFDDRKVYRTWLQSLEYETLLHDRLSLDFGLSEV
jgi:hypothetical protein